MDRFIDDFQRSFSSRFPPNTYYYSPSFTRSDYRPHTRQTYYTQVISIEQIEDHSPIHQYKIVYASKVQLIDNDCSDGNENYQINYERVIVEDITHEQLKEEETTKEDITQTQDNQSSAMEQNKNENTSATENHIPQTPTTEKSTAEKTKPKFKTASELKFDAPKSPSQSVSSMNNRNVTNCARKRTKRTT